MIYESVTTDAPIRQGDIFGLVPRVDVNLGDLLEVQDDRLTRADLGRVLSPERRTSAVIASITPVPAIVISQDCDTQRDEFVSLAEILTWASVDRTPPNSPKKWYSAITRRTREQLRHFYLPPDPEKGFAERSLCDFGTVIRISRIDLDSLRVQRRFRLGAIADEHFREQIAQFFRRYPYDEWYPLSAEEFQAYNTDKGPVRPFPWQA